MYSQIVSDHFHHPRRVGPLDGATHTGTAGTPGEGPYVVLWVKLEDKLITAAAYKTFGCPAAIASASVLVELIEGRSVSGALKIDTGELEVALDGLPEGKDHCPRLAVQALKHALSFL